VGKAFIFRCFSRITPSLCISHKFRWLIYYYVPPDSPIGHTQILGVMPPRGWECVLFFVIIFCALPQTKRVDLQIFRQDVGVDGHGKQSTRHDIFSQGSRGGLGAPFGAKMSTSEIHGKNCNPHISETVRPIEPNEAQIRTAHQCARRRDSPYEVWWEREVKFTSPTGLGYFRRSDNWEWAYVQVNGVAVVDSHYLDVFARCIPIDCSRLLQSIPDKILRGGSKPEVVTLCTIVSRRLYFSIN